MESDLVKAEAKAALGLRVLMQNRPNALTQRGGDTLVMEQLAQALRNQGVEVVIDLQGQANPKDFDVVHLFNFALPDLLKAQAERVVQAKVPYVVTTLCEDVPTFHNQSHAYAAALGQYVQSGQDRKWWEQQQPYLMEVARSPGFNNDWVAKNAAALLSSGLGESRVLRRDYPEAAPIFECHFGFQSAGQSGPELFVEKYGIKDFVFCVGRLESRKNQLMLLKALEDSELPVVLAAGQFSYQPEYAQAVAAFKRRGKTVVLQWLSAEELASAYSAARMHALVSWYELPGLVSIESAQQGRNLVATDTGSTKDYLGSAAYYCQPYDQESIYNAVIAAYYAPVKPALQQLPLAFTWERSATEVLRVYQGIVKQPEVAVTSAATDRLAQAIAGLKLNSTEKGAQGLEELLQSAEKLAQQRQFEDSERSFKQIVAANPTCDRALRGLGAVLLAQDRCQDAREYLEQAHKLNPRDARILSGLAMVCSRTGQLEVAYSYLLKAIEIEPDRLVTIMQLVEVSFALNKYDQLEKALKEYLAKKPDDLNMQFCLAGCLFKLGKIEQAHELNQQVLLKQPQHAGALDLSKQITKLPQPQSILPSRPSQGLDPIGSDIELKIAALEEEKAKRNYERVLQQSRAILEKCTTSPRQRERLLLLQAEGLLFSADLDGAAKIYSEILRDNPGSCRARCGQAVLAAEKNDWLEAEGLFKQALEQDHGNDLALAGLGLCSHRAGLHEQAWSYYLSAQRKNPENMRALLGLIELAYALNHCVELEDALKRYLDMHPADLDFVYALAGCYFAQNRWNDSLAELEKIMLFNPTHERACELRDIIYQKQGAGELAPLA